MYSWLQKLNQKIANLLEANIYMYLEGQSKGITYM